MSRRLLVITLICMFALPFAGRTMLAQGPDGRVLKAFQSAKVYTDANGELDAGYQVRGIVHNRGSRAVFVVTATLSSSEGEWRRSRTVLLDNEQAEILEFDFPEPTIGATDVRGRVSIRVQ